MSSATRKPAPTGRLAGEEFAAKAVPLMIDYTGKLAKLIDQGVGLVADLKGH